MRRRIATVAALGAVLLASAGSARTASSFVGIPDDQMGQHGPLTDILDGLELVGRSDLRQPGKAALGNHGGVALIDDCAYVGRWHDYRGRDGVAIVDVSDPATPHSIGVVADSVMSGGVTRELRAIDLGDEELLVALIFAQATGDRSRNFLRFFAPMAGDCTQMQKVGEFDMRAFRGHEFFLWVGTNAVTAERKVLALVTAPVSAPNVLVVDLSDPATPLLVGAYDGGSPIVSPDEAAGTYLGTYAHSVSLSDDGTEAYLSYWDGGFYTMDASALTTAGGTLLPKGAMSVPLRHGLDEQGNAHSLVAIPETGALVGGFEIYGSTDGCPYGWMRFIDPGTATDAPAILSDFRLDANSPFSCVDMPGIPPPTVPLDSQRQTVDVRNSLGELIDGTFTMHNQTVVGSYVLASWYGAGLRIVDASDASAPTEAAYFVPRPNDVHPLPQPDTSAPIWGAFGSTSDDWYVATWSYPVVRDGLIYVTDIRNGLYILRATPGSDLDIALNAVPFAEGNSNLGSLIG
jgi:hypothetical protein